MKPKPGRYGIEGWLRRSWLHTGYWKTLSGLRADRSSVVVDGASLCFIDYPFEPATVFPTGAVTADQIAEVNLGRPSHVRLKNGDILFVSQPSKDALVTFINRTDVKTERRGSVWAALLDPFLDTWEEQATIDAQFAWLAKVGVDRDAADRWRREVAPAMVAYNFGTRLWEWTMLDLYDVLRAQRARLSGTAFADFYSRAMRLAQLDPLSEDWIPSTETASVSSTLFAVLIEWYPRENGSLKSFSKRWDARTEHVKQWQQKLTAELTSSYSEAHRRYHTLVHIEYCLRQLNSVWNYAVRLNEIRWAILFHDAIYDSRRDDNEARSADWACKAMEEVKRPADEQARVRAMILATAHAGEPRTADEALLLDIDLSIFGADEAIFDEYDRSIRTEYNWVPASAYREARAKVLGSFVNREPLYRTVSFRQRYEATARKNIERALRMNRAPRL